MPIFRKKSTPKKVESELVIVSEKTAYVIQEDDYDEIAAVITAAICAGGGSSSSSLVVRSIVRVPEQNTAWNRLNLENNII